MKKSISILLLLVSSFVYSQAYPVRIKDHSTNLFGLAYHYSTEINQSYYDTILAPVYQDVVELNEKFLLLSEETKKIGKATFYINAQIVSVKDKTLTESKVFQHCQYSYLDSVVLENRGNLSALYDPFEEKYLIENFSSLERFSKCPMCKPFYSVVSDDKACVYNSQGEIILKTNSSEHINYDSDLKLFVQGEKLRTYYDTNGKTVLNEVSEVKNLCPRITFKRYYQLSCKDKTSYLYANGKVIIASFNGSFLSDIQNLNRIVAKTSEGYVVFDSTGKRINQEVYEFLYPAIQNDKEKQYNLVKKEGKWFFVDDNYLRVKEESFFFAEVVQDLYWSGNFYRVQKTKEQKGYYVYNSKGNAISNDLYTSVEYDDYYGEDLLLEKNGLWSICNGEKPGEFKYSSVQILEEFLSGPYYICEIPGNPEQPVLYDNTTQTEYFSDWKISRIGLLEDQYDYKWLLLIYDFNNKFQIVNMSKSISEGVINQRAFEFEDYYFDEEAGYDYNVLFVRKNKLWGIYNTDSLVNEIPCAYDKMYWDDYNFMDYNLLKVEKDGKMGALKVYRGIYTEIAAPIYDEIELFEDALVVKQDKKYGVLNIENGSVLAPAIFLEEPTYDMIFSDELSYRQKAIIDNIEKECIIKQAYGESPELLCFKNLQPIPEIELFTFEHKGKTGVISFGLDTVLQPIFDEVQLNSDFDTWLTKINDKNGLRSWGGEVVLNEEYDELITDKLYFTSIVFLKKGEKWGAYLSEENKTVFEFELLELTEDYILAKKAGKWGTLTHSLQPHFEFKFNSKEELLEAIEAE